MSFAHATVRRSKNPVNRKSDKRKEVICMFGTEFCEFPYWWVFPLVMIILCFLLMKGWRSMRMFGCGPFGTDNREIGDSNTALEILSKRYALGEIDKEEFEEKRSELEA